MALSSPSSRSFAQFAAFPRFRSLSWMPLLACLAAGLAPGTAEAKAARGNYDGVWNVVFATTRGVCSSGYSVPFTVM